MLHTVQTEPLLFSSQALKDMYKAGLGAVAQNGALIIPGTTGEAGHDFLSQLFIGTAQALAQAGPQGLFTPDLAQDVVGMALDTLAQNARQLIKPGDPSQQLLVQALERVILSFSGELDKNTDLPGILAATFSQRQLKTIIQEVFDAVAKNPNALLPGPQNDRQRSAVAQIVGAVAAMVSQDSQRLLTGDGHVELLRVALEAFARNPDRLLNLDTADPKDNDLTRVMSAVLKTAADNLRPGGYHLLWEEALLQATEAALAAVSKNTEGFKSDHEIVGLVLKRLLEAASGDQANVLDAENVLLVFSPLLTRALKDGQTILSETDQELILPYLTLNQ